MADYLNTVRVIISCLFLRVVLLSKSIILQKLNVLISKKCAYFLLSYRA